MEIDITGVVNTLLVLAALYIGVRVVMLLGTISKVLRDILAVLLAKEHDRA